MARSAHLCGQHFGTKMIAAAVALAGLVTGAQAGPFSIQFDLNSLAADAGGAFGGVTHTGQVDFSADADASLAGIFIDGVEQTVTGSLSNLTGSVMLNNGQVAGGQFSFSLDDGSSFMASIVDGQGEVNPQAGEGFQISGLTFNGQFDSLVGGTMFGGVDVSPWDAVEPFNGAFTVGSFGPDSNGFDAGTNLDLFQFVPTPGGAALFGLAGLAALRRRR